MSETEKQKLIDLCDELEMANELKDKVIDLMAFEIAEITGSCPNDRYGVEWRGCLACLNTQKQCFKEYFYKKAEEEK